MGAIKRHHARRYLAILWATLLLLPFNNCSKKVQFESTKINYNGNGDAYEGKLTRYSHYDSPCAEVGKNGQPLPNRQIYLFGDYPNIKAQLVRDNCTDRDVPLELDISQVTFSGPSGTGDLLYAGASFQVLQQKGDFDVVAAECPAGRTPLSSPSRVNLLASSQNLSDSNAYMPTDGISATLNGSLASLPRYEILRNDPNFTDFWRRVGQVLPLPAGKTYAFTFLAKESSSQWAGFSFYEAMDYTFSLSVNLLTGQVRDDGNVGVPNVQTVSRLFGGGRLITIYFTTPKPAAYAAVGVYPSAATGQPNKYLDSIHATALQLVDVANFCAP